MEQKLDHRLPQGQLTLALPDHSGGLGKEMVLARIRACPPHDSGPLSGIVSILQNEVTHRPWHTCTPTFPEITDARVCSGLVPPPGFSQGSPTGISFM